MNYVRVVNPSLQNFVEKHGSFDAKKLVNALSSKIKFRTPVSFDENTIIFSSEDNTRKLSLIFDAKEEKSYINLSYVDEYSLIIYDVKPKILGDKWNDKTNFWPIHFGLLSSDSADEIANEVNTILSTWQMQQV